MDLSLLIKDPEKKAKSLVRKITHSGETDLDKELLQELKNICKASKDDLLISVYKECMKCLHKEHAQVRVSTVKLIDYFFQKSHIFRERLLDKFDVFLELTLAISQQPKVKLKLPPPKKFAALLQELTAKQIHAWHSDFACGYEKIRYVHNFLREHQLVDFSRFQVRTHEELIKRQKLLEKQEKILSRSIENRLKEFRELKPEIDQLIAQIESLLDLLLPMTGEQLDKIQCPESSDCIEQDRTKQQHHGIVNLSHEIQVEFSPFVEITRTRDNKDVVQDLKEMKKQLVESKMTKLISIEKTIAKRSDQFVNTLKDIIDLKSKAMNLILKLGELKIINEPEEGKSTRVTNLDNISDDDDNESDFEEVEPKEDLESYIPKSLRSEYGLLEAIDPKEVQGTSRSVLTDEIFIEGPIIASTSAMAIPCNVRLESGKLCPRRDKIKCPFHGRIVPRDHRGVPLDESERSKEEKKTKNERDVPDWQDPRLLRDIKEATGVDLTMPKKGQKRPNEKKLSNTKTCDLTPKQRLQKRLKMLHK